LGAVAAPLAEVPGELRVRVQEAQRDWFLAVAQERPLVVLVDDLEHADDGSAAFLLSLALAASQAKLLLVCTLVRDRVRERSPAVRALLKAGNHMPLAPLSQPELHELLSSVFGAATHLSRLSARLFELTRGNTRHTLELCRQLVDRGTISFESGSWTLPQELDTHSLAADLDQALAARLSRVTGPARELLRLLGVHTGTLSPGICRALAACTGRDLLPQLGELIQAEILVQSGQNLLFAHEQFRRVCADELAPDALRSARAALAEQLLAMPDAGPLERLHASVHLLEAGDARGAAMAVRESLYLVAHDVEKLVPAAPALEAALRLFREQNRSPYEQIALLTALTLAGYEGQRRYVMEYGQAAVSMLESLLGLHQARRWRRFLGATLALGAGLGLAAVRFLVRRNNPCVPGFVQAVYMLFTATAAASGAHAICFDPQGAARLADVLQPFAALPSATTGRFMAEFCQALVTIARDDQHATHERWRMLLTRLDTLGRFVPVPEGQMKRCRGGVLFAIASLETHRDDGDSLRCAEALDENGLQLDRVCADQIRMLHHGFIGDIAGYEHYRQRAELHAIARGTTWQFETWLPGPASSIASYLHDALSMKSSADQMQRLSEGVETLAVHARLMRGCYLVLRGKYAEAIPFIVECLEEPPCSRIAWARSHGMLAQAYNRMGDHAAAHAACMRVIEHCPPRNFEYPHVNLVVETERVVAEAGLGRIEQARVLLAGLRTRFGASRSPLLRGQLRETGLELALLHGDLSAAREELAGLEAEYQPLSIPSLAQHCRVLAARVEQLAGGPAARMSLRPFAAANTNSELSSAIAEQLTDETLPELAEHALRLLAENMRADSGALYLIDSESSLQLGARLAGEQPSALVARWVSERLARELEDERTMLETDVSQGEAPWNLLREGTREYRMLVLSGSDASLLAIVVLGRDGTAPGPCRSALARLVAERLHAAVSDERTGRSTFGGCP
ncbi:MAG TPA: hypothetical protein VJV78_32195, partial [Polyangiales bacterium]|nr:hypothetical protein [Polyangiales bacterium]